MCPRLKLEETGTMSFRPEFAGLWLPLVHGLDWPLPDSGNWPSRPFSELRIQLRTLFSSTSAEVQDACWFPSSPFPLSHKGLFKAQFLISYWDPFLDAEIKKIRGSRTGYVSVMLTKLQACSQLLYRKILTIFNHRKLPREAQVTSFYTVTIQERFHLE